MTDHYFDPANIEPLPNDPKEALRLARAEFGTATRAQWVIERKHYEPQRTLSAEVVEQTVAHMGRFLVVRLNDIWDDTGKPPQALTINLHVPGPLETEDDMLRARSQLQSALADVDLRLTMLRRGEHPAGANRG